MEREKGDEDMRERREESRDREMKRVRTRRFERRKCIILVHTHPIEKREVHTYCSISLYYNISQRHIVKMLYKNQKAELHYFWIKNRLYI